MTKQQTGWTTHEKVIQHTLTMQMYLYQIPENETELPMVFLHGYGQSRMGWMTTPDGREGWSTSSPKKRTRSIFGRPTKTR